ncbi:MAG: hypothetical protein A3J55_01325 [Candidatus Ryanbacteria bacterium RIFCSPHIGHO2_02_FULL_45_17b]|uniref:Uncharacterized protein n=1 Tax=Candidatus Ryanbacteria bacterium RIFCSPHIGHO2_01_FULL_45_22 TaxID=1802114 RepID=A0A1G2G156_9BACT|nr:MAG: hypothetical protein A2719_03795 [Candidatus Ryanbacteria bacterium RIFCSPHIGHO2_01_FULL_45_22]OGZ47175.1 MAG: hypothetical protein A3J55_01325 [Candidatus Ryanbacteria bacterium RIFCSPHIGHO2_02_FULL_45_17b]
MTKTFMKETNDAIDLVFLTKACFSFLVLATIIQWGIANKTDIVSAATQAGLAYSPEEFTQLRDMSCAAYDQLIEDRDNKTCIEHGACLRSPEKLRKMCDYRVPNMMKYCSMGKLNQARTEISNALHAMDDHIELRVHYCLTKQIDCEMVAQRLGEPWLTREDVGFSASKHSRSIVRDHVFEIGKKLPLQNPVEIYPLTIYAALYQRLQQQNVCE